MKKLINTYENVSRKKKIPMGYHQVRIDLSEANRKIKKNYKYICVGTDLEFLNMSCKHCKKIKSLMRIFGFIHLEWGQKDYQESIKKNRKKYFNGKFS